MTDWIDRQALVRGAQQRTYGEPAAYTPREGGASTELTAILLPSMERVDASGLLVRRDEIHVSKADLPAPRKRDRITVGGRTYEIDAFEEQPGGLGWVLLPRLEIG